MNQVRGVIMILLGGFAFYQGWVLPTGQRSLMAYGVGVLAVAVGVWRLTRKPPERLV
jgi:hypothetical protein